MTFHASRKINLANIDSTVWPYEVEEIGLEGCASMDDALHQLDVAVAARVEHYRKLAVSLKTPKVIVQTPVQPDPGSTGGVAPVPGISTVPPSKFQ